MTDDIAEAAAAEAKRRRLGPGQPLDGVAYLDAKATDPAPAPGRYPWPDDDDRFDDAWIDIAAGLHALPWDLDLAAVLKHARRARRSSRPRSTTEPHDRRTP